MNYLDFEKPLAELEGKIKDLEASKDNGIDIEDEIYRLRTKADKLMVDIYSKLTSWQKTQIARHPDRPHFHDYSSKMVTQFEPLAGDRLYGEDKAIMGGLCRLNGRSIMLIGHEKGHDIESRLAHNFGMAKPEGYRKAIRLMNLANSFKIPVVTLVDTPGAYPGLGAEERGQAEAIAKAQEASFKLEVPFISVIVGEGGSGGAVALATSNKVFMLEHSIYSVISPEGCASILWKEEGASKVETAADAMKVSAQSLFQLGIIDKIIAEPLGGAHRDKELMIQNLGNVIDETLVQYEKMSIHDIKEDRYNKFSNIGNFEE